MIILPIYGRSHGDYSVQGGMGEYNQILAQYNRRIHNANKDWSRRFYEEMEAFLKRMDLQTTLAVYLAHPGGTLGNIYKT